MSRDDMSLEQERDDIRSNIKNLEYELSVSHKGSDEYYSIQDEINMERCLLEDVERKLKALEEAN